MFSCLQWAAVLFPLSVLAAGQANHCNVQIPSHVWTHCIYPYLDDIWIRRINKNACEYFEERHEMQCWITLRRMIVAHTNSSRDFPDLIAKIVETANKSGFCKMTGKIMVLLQRNPFLTATQRIEAAVQLRKNILKAAGRPAIDLVIITLHKMADIMQSEAMHTMSSTWRLKQQRRLRTIFLAARVEWRCTGNKYNRYLEFALLHVRWLAQHKNMHALLWRDICHADFVIDYLLSNVTLSPTDYQDVIHLIMEDAFNCPNKTEVNKQRFQLFLMQDRLLFDLDTVISAAVRVARLHCVHDKLEKLAVFIVENKLASCQEVLAAFKNNGVHGRKREKLLRALNDTSVNVAHVHNPLAVRPLVSDVGGSASEPIKAIATGKCCNLM